MEQLEKKSGEGEDSSSSSDSEIERMPEKRSKI
jgi:hypothetical protein